MGGVFIKIFGMWSKGCKLHFNVCYNVKYVTKGFIFLYEQMKYVLLCFNGSPVFISLGFVGEPVAQLLLKYCLYGICSHMWKWSISV